MEIRNTLWVAPASLAIGLAVWTCSLAGAFADSIALSDGQRYEKITGVKATWKAVEFRVRKQKKRVAAEKVRSLTRDSKRLRKVREARAAEDYEGALRVLTDVDLSKATPWEAAEGAYLQGALEFELARFEDADASLEAYLDAYRKSEDWWVPFAVRSLAMTQLSLGKARAAEVYFKSLATLGPRWELRAKLGQASALLAAGKKSSAQAARSLAREVYDRAENDALKEEALLVRAETWIVAQGPERAITSLEAFFFDSPKRLAYSAARARATLLVAQSHAALAQRDGKGNDREAKKHLENAELWALRVATLYRHYGEVYLQACDALVAVYEGLGRDDLAAAWQQRREAL